MTTTTATTETKPATLYVIVDGEGRLARMEVFTNKATADFARSGMVMFAEKGSTDSFYVRPMVFMDGGVEDFLALAGLGPKGRR